MTVNKHSAIVSAFKGDFDSATNDARSSAMYFALVSRLGSDSIKPVKGFYMGDSEDSYLVDLGATSLDWIVTLASAFDQDSVLYVGDDLKSDLVFTDGSVMNLGTFAKVDSVDGLDGWTLDPDTGDTYAAI